MSLLLQSPEGRPCKEFKNPFNTFSSKGSWKSYKRHVPCLKSFDNKMSWLLSSFPPYIYFLQGKTLTISYASVHLSIIQLCIKTLINRRTDLSLALLLQNFNRFSVGCLTFKISSWTTTSCTHTTAYSSLSIPYHLDLGIQNTRHLIPLCISSATSIGFDCGWNRNNLESFFKAGWAYKLRVNRFVWIL